MPHLFESFWKVQRYIFRRMFYPNIWPCRYFEKFPVIFLNLFWKTLTQNWWFVLDQKILGFHKFSFVYVFSSVWPLPPECINRTHPTAISIVHANGSCHIQISSSHSHLWKIEATGKALTPFYISIPPNDNPGSNWYAYINMY